MFDVSKIPSAWVDYLTQIQQEYPQAVLGGGCLRDLYHDKEVKDVDIFIPNSTECSQDFLDAYSDAITAKLSDYNGFANQDVSCVLTMNNNIKSELIFITTPTAIERFDFGICQIQFDGKSLLYSDHFMNDVTNKTFTLVRCDNSKQYDRSMTRYERLLQKYPNYKFVNRSSYRPRSFWSDKLDITL
jgi:hypothetical protein